MKKATSKHNRINSLADRAPRTLLPLFAVGGSLAAGQAAAIELGEATVQSRLGQPLRASIAFALAPTEQLSESCISLGLAKSGLPGIGRANISIADGTLLLRGSTPIREPLVATNVVISCPTAAQLAREYMMFIDPASATVAEPTPAAQSTVAAQSSTVSRASESAASTGRSTPTATPPATAPRASTRVKREPIGPATRYRVRPGDSLSEITQRIQNRPPGLWAAVDTVFQANPDAFIDGDPNKLKAGSWLSIPSFDGSEPVVAESASTSAKPVVIEVEPATDTPTVAAVTSPVVVSQPVESAAVQPPEAVVDTTVDLQPGEANASNDNAAALTEVAASETIDIPDTALVGPETISTSPNVATATVQQRAEQATSSWMLWLAGSGVAILLALLLFGRSLRSRFGSAPNDLESELPVREASPESDALALRDDMENYIVDQTEECAVLDADLLMGTGLNVSTEVDPAEDIGTPSPTEVDIEFPFAEELETAQGDDAVRPAAMSADSTILESEILPGSDAYPDPEDFDMSVILDATKMPQPEVAGATALEAIDMDSLTDTTDDIDADDMTVDEVTVGSTLDLTILAQDYEDELTATQTLNMEATHAAIMLSGELNDTGSPANDKASSNDDATASTSLAEVTDFDVKTHLEPDNDKTVALDKNQDLDDDFTIQLLDDEDTVEVEVVDGDETREMPAKGGKLNKKAG